MQSTVSISMASAEAVLAGVFAEARRLDLKPLGAVVLDAGGHIIAARREDGAASLRIGIAGGKAGGALGLGMSSREIGVMAAERPAFVASLSTLVPGGVVPTAGGIVVIDQ